MFTNTVSLNFKLGHDENDSFIYTKVILDKHSKIIESGTNNMVQITFREIFNNNLMLCQESTYTGSKCKV